VRKTHILAGCLALTLTSLASAAFIMDFDTDASGAAIPAGATISDQYAAWGATFTPGGSTGSSGEYSYRWATNTTLKVGTSYSSSTPPPAGIGQFLHQYNDWFNQDGSPVFTINFPQGATGSISALFFSINATSNFQSGIKVYDGTTLLASGNTLKTGGGAQTLTVDFAGTATKVIINPGGYTDWVGVDNITFTPEPASLAGLLLGGLLAWRRR